MKIITYPHPTLRYKSVPVMRVDAELRNLVAQMFDLMYAEGGVGLAANQVDLPLRLFVCNPAAKRGEGEEYVFINPVVRRAQGWKSDEEGCLSIPGVRAQVRRPVTVHLQAYNLRGEEMNLELDGFPGRIVQHEVDHLDGILFTDRLNDLEKLAIQESLEEFELEFRRKREIGEIPNDQQIFQRLSEIEARYGKPRR